MVQSCPCTCFATVVINQAATGGAATEAPARTGGEDNTYDTYNTHNTYNTYNTYNTHNTHNTYNTYRRRRRRRGRRRRRMEAQVG